MKRQDRKCKLIIAIILQEEIDTIKIPIEISRIIYKRIREKIKGD